MSGISYSWSAVNGTITSGQNTNSVNVSFSFGTNRIVRCTIFNGSVYETFERSINATGTANQARMSVAESDEIIETENLMEDNDSNIIVFPNPSSDIVNLEMKLPDTYTLFLHNSDTGVLIYQSTFNGNTTQLDLSKFTNKRIIVKVVSSDNQIFYKRIIRR
jgi:hypothetical protein